MSSQAVFTIVHCMRHGLEVWVIFDCKGQEVGSTLSREGVERRVLQLQRHSA